MSGHRHAAAQPGHAKPSPPVTRGPIVSSGRSAGVSASASPNGGRGFADNIPAFLRKPVKRPAKVAGE